MSISHEELAEINRRSIEDPKEFWSEVARRLVWYKDWTSVHDDSLSPGTKWFLGGEINLCYNCVDRHVEAGHGDRTAIIFNSPVTQTRRCISFKETQDHVSRLAGAMLGLGVQKGDVVMIYTPMIAEGAFAMLACARIGALHACVPSGLPAMDLTLRMDHSKPKLILMASWGYHPSGWKNYKVEIDEAYQKATWKAEKIIVLQREIKDSVSMVPDRDLDWMTLVDASAHAQCVPMDANEPQFMVYTSGSTGAPKAIVHAVGRFAVRMECDTPFYFGSWEEEDVVLGTSNFGWVAGHSLVLYGPLIKMIPTVIFEGDPLLSQDVRALYRLLSENKVTGAFIRPGILKLLKGMDPEGTVASEFDFGRMKNIIIGGERIDLKTMEWVVRILGVSVWNAWGQSELSSVITGIPDNKVTKVAPMIQDFGASTPGWNYFILKHDGSQAQTNELGRVLIRLPLPPGGLLTIFGNEEQFRKNYFEDYPGFFDTKDEGYLNEEGQLKIGSRVDDIMKVGLVYLSAQAIEEIILSHDAVAECVVVSLTDLVWKEIPVALYMKKNGSAQSRNEEEEICRELENLVYQKFGTSIKFGGAALVKELPRTRTGKVHRPSCKALVLGQKIQVTGVLENPHVFSEIAVALESANFGRDVLME